jgi:hypothetical protein
MQAIIVRNKKMRSLVPRNKKKWSEISAVPRSATKDPGI